MSEGIIIRIAQEALWTIIETSAPLLLISLIVGLIISIFQTVTSIQEQTLTFVPKILAVFVGMMIFGSWILNDIVALMNTLWSNFAAYTR
ncbi:MAG: flagellar biosynthesis protein FliQ [Lachnospiraceae bacterium]|nr:flagellar biosynthesis protein FliQ [Lachnospiraceae bacterium]